MSAEPHQSVRVSIRAPHLVRNVALAGAVMVALPIVGYSSDTSEASTAASVHPEEPTVPVAPPPPPPPLFGETVEGFVPGTYFVDEVDGFPTPRIFVTLGEGWSTGGEWAISKDGVGYVTFSRPDAVFLDACQSADGYHPGPLTTLDGLVAALGEQGGWVDVTAPTEISVNGYDGQAFQRRSPAEFVDCDTSFAPFRSWEYQDENGRGEGWSFYSTDEIETLLVLDVDGTIIIVSTRTGAEDGSAADQAAAEAELAAVVDSVRIDPPPPPLFGAPVEGFVPGTYFVDEVDGFPTPRIFVTLDAGWSTGGGWGISNEAGYVTFSRPDAVFLDACQSADGYHPGPVTTLDGLVAALSEQRGWVDVTAPTDISVNGYEGEAFQRTAPAEFVDCSTSFAPFRSWEYQDENGRGEGWSFYEPGEIETLWVLDIDDTIIIINTRTSSDQPAAAHNELVATRDSIRIDPE